MEELETVSKVVDEANDLSVLPQQQSDAILLRSKVPDIGTTPDQVISETSNDTRELTLAVSNDNIEEENETEVNSFDNPAFDYKGIKQYPKRKSFADVVTKLINDPIQIDVHPFGRGSIYGRALGGEQRGIPREEGALFMWALVTLIILGVAVGVIALSLMYQANQRLQDTAVDALNDSNVTSY